MQQWITMTADDATMNVIIQINILLLITPFKFINILKIIILMKVQIHIWLQYMYTY